MYFSFLLNIFISNPTVTLKCYIIKQTEKIKQKQKVNGCNFLQC